MTERRPTPCATARLPAGPALAKPAPAKPGPAALAAALAVALAAVAPTAAAQGAAGSPAAGSSPAASPAGADPSPAAVEMGRREYEDNCATCHGMDARGDGPMRPFLARTPADLTTLARRHGGTFPRSTIADLIDGRGIDRPGSHGSREMPIWGRVYREQSVAQTRGTPFPAEWSVRGRIIALVDYLQSLQQP